MPWSSTKWLGNSSGVYWITGKPGPGKSTLMKYIYQDLRTKQHLKAWAGDLPLITAGYFFWNSGTRLQTSQMGLLRSLLHESLSQAPHLIADVFPRRWTAFNSFGQDLHPWSLSELKTAFNLLTDMHGKSISLCYFIDGLDEFGGDTDELLELLRSTVQTSGIKLCIASRPWNEFEDAYRIGPSLMLQDLTKHDMEHYITSRLRTNGRFTTLEKEEPRFAIRLAKDIADKASGVFLWVHLVVRSLIAGLANCDRAFDLQTRLQFIPGNLEKLYLRMIDTIDDFYFEHAAQLFQIARVTQDDERLLTILTLSFADEDPDYALNSKIKPLPYKDKLARSVQMHRRLDRCCRGLLEVSTQPNDTSTGTTETKNLYALLNHRLPEQGEDSSNLGVQTVPATFDYIALAQFDFSPELTDQPPVIRPSSKVTYLHRTARDFLNGPVIWKRFQEVTKHSFSPELAVLRAHTMQLKTLLPGSFERDDLSRLTDQCMRSAARAEASTNSLQSDLMDNVEQTVTEWTQVRDPGGLYVLKNLATRGDSQWTYIHDRANLSNNFLTFSANYNLPLYIHNKFDRSEIHDKSGRSLLDYVTSGYKNYPGFSDKQLSTPAEPLPSFLLIKLLLEKGADPNERYMCTTPWETALLKAKEDAVRINIASTCKSRLMQRWSEIIEAFIQYGAKANTSSNVTISAALSKWDPRRARELENMHKRRWIRSW